jgi:hypothetical protein
MAEEKGRERSGGETMSGCISVRIRKGEQEGKMMENKVRKRW